MHLRTVLLLAIGSIALLTGACSTADDGKPSTPTTADALTPTTLATMPPGTLPDTTDAELIDVVDGDTLKVRVAGVEQTVRIIGVNAPELGECFHDEATTELRLLVTGKPLRLDSDITDIDQYGRLLRYVSTDIGDVGEQLVLRGMALARPYPPDTLRSAVYSDRQTIATAAGSGMWAATACGPATTTVTIDVDVHPIPDSDIGIGGPDLRDEWVKFTNSGPDPIDVSGWTLADESSSNRYTFPPAPLQPGAAITVVSGCGTDDSATLYWCTLTPSIWNNSSDTVLLRDVAGNIVVSHHYGP